MLAVQLRNDVRWKGHWQFSLLALHPGETDCYKSAGRCKGMMDGGGATCPGGRKPLELFELQAVHASQLLDLLEGKQLMLAMMAPCGLAKMGPGGSMPRHAERG